MEHYSTDFRDELVTDTGGVKENTGNVAVVHETQANPREDTIPPQPQQSPPSQTVSQPAAQPDPFMATILDLLKQTKASVDQGSAKVDETNAKIDATNEKVDKTSAEITEQNRCNK